MFLSFLPGKYSLKGIIKAYWDLFEKRKWIRGQRELVNKIKTVEEKEVIKYLSGRIFNGNNFVEKFFNFFSLLYCRIVNIKVIEFK
jgi:hypothetical protein